MSLHLTPLGMEQLLTAPDHVALGYRAWHRATFRTDEYIVSIEILNHAGDRIVVTSDTTYEHPAGRGFVPDAGPQPEPESTKRVESRVISTPFPIDLLAGYLVESAA